MFTIYHVHSLIDDFVIEFSNNYKSRIGANKIIVNIY